jgi:pimeloyl-ACP methyl ester carboxylesterase
MARTKSGTREPSLTQHSHQTAPTQFVEAAGIRFAYRRFGKFGGVPLVFNMHFTGTMDHWDPLVTDGLAATREVILFNNVGISSTNGEVPSSVEEMAADALAFINLLNLETVDVLGFSLGGMVAQALTEGNPGLVRRLILVGTGPRGGRGMATLTAEAQSVFGATYANPDDKVAGRFLHAKPNEPDCRPSVSSAFPLARRRSRSGSERERRGGADRCARQMGRSARERVRLSPRDHTTNVGDQRQ